MSTHGIRRAEQRYGLALDRSDMRLLADKIIAGLATEFERESKTVSKFFVTTPGGTELPVVYSRKRKRIITVLPLDAAEVLRAKAKGLGAPGTEDAQC